MFDLWQEIQRVKGFKENICAFIHWFCLKDVRSSKNAHEKSPSNELKRVSDLFKRLLNNIFVKTNQILKFMKITLLNTVKISIFSRKVWSTGH